MNAPITSSGRRQTPYARRVARASLLVSLATATACGGVEPYEEDEIGRRELAIVWGQPETAHPAVGRLLTRGVDGGTDSCTATLIGSRTVLTAAHCVVGAKEATFTVEVGDRQETFTADAYEPHPLFDADTHREHDIALLTLTGEPPVEPAYVASNPPRSGQAVTVVGYGATAPDLLPDGVKRRVDTHIATVGVTQFELTKDRRGTFCKGDSGGPSFSHYAFEVVVGVHFGFRKSENICEGGIDTRVDYYVPWIKRIAGDDVRIEGGSIATASAAVTASEHTASDGDPPLLACSVQPGSNPEPLLLPLSLLLIGFVIRSRSR